MVNRSLNVIVTNYNENWVEIFKEEAKRIREVLVDEIVEIYHIGSTSVPGLKAKPIIDIMPIVRDIAAVDMYNTKMIEIGYEPLGEFGIKGRRYFRKGGENRTHHVHIFQIDNKNEIERHLAVRDYLRSHEKAAIEYGNLKEKLAKAFPKDIEGYIAGKDEFVKNLEQKAIVWWQKNNK